MGSRKHVHLALPCLSLACILALHRGCGYVIDSQSKDIDFQAEASRIQPWLVETRRALHEMPELLYEEVETSQYIRNALDELQISYRQALLGRKLSDCRCTRR